LKRECWGDDSIMKHVSDLWFERVSHRPARGRNSSVTHVLVVVTDLVTDMDIPDTGDLADLEDALRKQYPEADDLRFVPVRTKAKARAKPKATKRDPAERAARLRELGRKLA